jgi:hypothetical protein
MVKWDLDGQPLKGGGGILGGFHVCSCMGR